MKKRLEEGFTEFGCDNPICKKMIKYKKGYPYNKGWVYLHKLSGKRKINNKIKEYKFMDKHFCSLKCQNLFMEKKKKR